MSTLINKKILYLLLVFIILTVGFVLRINNFAQIPPAGDTRDEYSFAVLGMSLFQLGKPIATSGLNTYKHDWQYLNVDDIFHRYPNPNPIPMDGPWFDHPPLFGLFAGAYPYFKGYTHFVDLSTTVIRKPMVILGVINVFLVLFLSTLLFNKSVGLFSAAIYATNPLFVISSRLVQAENLLITFLLLTLIIYYLYLKTKNNLLFWFAIALAGLSTLIKISGISLVLTLVVLTYILENKLKYQKIILICLGVGLFTLLFPIYGYLYDWNLFKAVWSANSDRYFRDGLLGFFSLITHTNTTRSFIDGWFLLGWMSLLAIKKSKKILFISVPLFSYLLVYLIFGSESYGWYKIPFYPLISIVLGYMFTKQSRIFNFFALFLAGGVLLNRFFPPESLRNLMWPYRFSLIGIFFLIFKSKYLTYIIFIFLILLNIWANYQININLWYKIE